MRRKCLDTYALVEISKANPSFAMYLSQDVVIPNVILVEFYGVLLREDGKQTADYWFRKLQGYCVDISIDILREAVIFRYNHRKNKISFFDAVAYQYSLFSGSLFVTGDKEFENMKNVEFRK